MGGKAVAAAAAVLVACGGQAGERGARAPGEGENGTEGIGDYAATHGGIRSLGGAPTTAAAAPDGLHADLLDTPVKLDGSLAEWPARFGLHDVVQGSGHAACGIAIQYDGQKLYVGGEVQSDALVRTDDFGPSEDHASLVLAFPTESGRYAAYEVGLYAGKPGESSGAVRLLAGGRRGDVAGAKIVEAPASADGAVDGNYSFEAQIPWSAFPEAARTRIGLRGVARFVKASAPGAVAVVIATGTGTAADPSSLPALPTESEQAMIEQLLAPKGLAGTAPAVDLLADVAGDGMLERVAVFGQYLTICGPSYLDGTRFYFKDLGGQLGAIEPRRITGRPKADLVVRRKVTVGGATRDWLEVLSVLGEGNPEVTFGHEVGIASGGKSVADDVSLKDKEITVTAGAARGWDASSFREATAEDVDPILLPWGPVRSQTYKFDGTHFAKTKEVANPNAASGVPAPAPRPRDVHPQEPPTPPARPAPADLSRQVFALYLRDRGLPAGTTPRYDIAVNVSGDPRPERVVLVGKDIVVFGPGFKDGTAYAYATLAQFDAPSDITDFSVRDVTGDGGADVIVKGTRRTSVKGSDDPVVMDTFFVYVVGGSAITRVFGAETGREMGGKRVQGRLQLIPARSGRGFDIDLQPGTASGWNEQTYPWKQDDPGGALEPLLLPWGGVRELRYSWNGSTYAQ